MKGKFWCDLYAVGENNKTVHVRVTGQNDPGYAETSRMVSEAALSLVENRRDLNAVGGVVTPAYAFGSVLIDRINKNTGTMKYEVVED
jgi:short subunit dehydrogenase-like uncharacterized protein